MTKKQVYVDRVEKRKARRIARDERAAAKVKAK